MNVETLIRHLSGFNGKMPVRFATDFDDEKVVASVYEDDNHAVCIDLEGPLEDQND